MPVTVVHTVLCSKRPCSLLKGYGHVIFNMFNSCCYGASYCRSLLLHACT